MSILVAPRRWTRGAWAIAPAATGMLARVRVSLARLMGWFGAVRTAPWVFAAQSEHLLAYTDEEGSAR